MRQSMQPNGRVLDLFENYTPDAIREAARQWIPIYGVELVRKQKIPRPVVTSPDDIAGVLSSFLARADRECFVVVMLATSLQVIGVNVAHVGSLSASVVHAREVFKPAILANASSIVVGHNHPSGNLEPSPADIAVSRELVAAGKLLSIPLLDSLVIGHDGQYTSLAERDLLS